MRKKIFELKIYSIAALCFIFAALSPDMYAQSKFFYTDFSDPGELIFQEKAKLLNKRIRLTEAEKSQIGKVWLKLKQRVDLDFAFAFKFQITGKDGNGLPFGGADGFAFVIQNHALTDASLVGQEIGYGGLPNSLAIEFDTYENSSVGDPDSNHISVHTRGIIENSTLHAYSLGSTSNIPNMSDGAVHEIRIDYTPGIMKIFMDDMGAPALTVSVDLGTLLSLDAGTAWVGFTSATGNEVENHDILSFGTPDTTFIEDVGPFCEGETIRLEAPNLSGSEFRWTGPNGWSSNEKTPVIENAATSMAGVYRLEVYGKWDSVSSETIVEILPAPAATIAPSGTLTICEGEDAVLTVSPSGPGFSCLWSTGETDREITVNATGLYSVIVEGENGCKDTASVFIYSVPMSGVEILADGPPSLCEGDVLTLRASPAGAEYSYLWSNGMTSEEITVESSGTFTVKVTHEAGCQGESEPYVVRVDSNRIEIIFDDEKEFVLDSAVYSERVCRPIRIKNISQKEYVTISDVLLARNYEFSIPPSQFDKVIPPGGEVELLLCYSPSAVGPQRDTLIFDDFCHPHILPVVGFGVENELEGLSRCGVGLRFGFGKPPRSAPQIETNPSPAADYVDLTASPLTSGSYVLNIYSPQGRIFATYSYEIDGVSSKRLRIPLSAYPAGVCQAVLIKASSYVAAAVFVVIK